MNQSTIFDIELIVPENPGYRAFVERKKSENRLARVARALNDHAMVATPDMTNIQSFPQHMSIDTTFAAIDPITSNTATSTTDMARMTTLSLPPQESRRTSTVSLGHLVEAAARQWIGCHLKLEHRRILTWREQSENGKTRKYAELDAVHRLDYDTVLIYEIKFASREGMLERRGAEQLDRAQRLLQNARTSRRVLKRLVYVGDASLAIPEVSAVKTTDLISPFGILWIDYQTIESIAMNRGTAMPQGWNDRSSPCSSPTQ